MIRLREGENESILTIDDFENRARRGEISPFAEVCLPAMTGERFVQARELSLFTAIYDPRRMLFQRHFHLGRYPLVTGLFALVCVALFLVARHMGDGVATREGLIALGAKARARIIDEGQLWRLLTANLLHRDGTHLGFNLFALLNIGTVLEGVYRRGDYLLLLVTGGIATMGLSTLMSGPVTVGASGIIFACLGCAVVFGLRFSEVLPVRYRLYFGVVVVGYAAVMFYLGLQRPTTDNWGHAGGLVSGLVMGALLEPRLMRLRVAREPPAVVARPYIVASVLLVLVVALGPLVPRVAFRWHPYHLDAFGIVLERPTTWTKGPDPLGFLAFGNGVDALASIACARTGPLQGTPRAELDVATGRFVDQELKQLERGGHIGSLQVGAPVHDSVGFAADGSARPPVVEARRVPFSFLASDGPFSAEAYVFVRGEMECAFVLARRKSASPRSAEILHEVKSRMQLVDTKAQRDANNAVLNHPELVRAQLDLALADEAAGDVPGARSAFDAAEKLVGTGGGFEGRVRVGRARFELDQGGDLDVALAQAERARVAVNDDPDVALLLVDVLIARGDLPRAQLACAAAITQFPGDTSLLERKEHIDASRSAPGGDGGAGDGGDRGDGDGGGHDDGGHDDGKGAP